MKTWKCFGIGMLTLAGMAFCMSGPARADEQGGAKPARQLAAFWAVPQEDGKATLVLAGQATPVTVDVSATTIISGICQDCKLPLDFKSGEAGKNCSVCGCSVSNAACIVGKPIKGSTWQALLKALPQGTGLWATFNDAGKPESGVKKLQVDLRSVLLPVTGLDGQTPDQLLALVKPVGGTSAELIDGNTRLSIKLNQDWSAVRADKLNKALAKINAKTVVAEETKPAQ